MAEQYEQQLEESLALYHRRRAELTEFQNGMAAISVTVVAPRKVVSVTMGNAGELKEIKFPTTAYRNLTPSELGSVLTTTIEDARSQALDRAAELLSAMLPPELDAKQLVRGKVDLAAMMPDDPIEANPLFDRAGEEVA
jgi:DNA-binding protein YbaB